MVIIPVTPGSLFFFNSDSFQLLVFTAWLTACLWSVKCCSSPWRWVHSPFPMFCFLFSCFIVHGQCSFIHCYYYSIIVSSLVIWIFTIFCINLSFSITHTHTHTCIDILVIYVMCLHYVNIYIWKVFLYLASVLHTFLLSWTKRKNPSAMSDNFICLQFVNNLKRMVHMHLINR